MEHVDDHVRCGCISNFVFFFCFKAPFCPCRSYTIYSLFTLICTSYTRPLPRALFPHPQSKTPCSVCASTYCFVYFAFSKQASCFVPLLLHRLGHSKKTQKPLFGWHAGFAYCNLAYCFLLYRNGSFSPPLTLTLYCLLRNFVDCEKVCLYERLDGLVFLARDA